MITTQIDVSYLIGVIVMLVLSLVAVGLGIAWWLLDGSGSSRAMSFWQGLGFTVVVLIVMWGLFAWLAWPPLPGQYNEYRPFSGTVAETGSRFIGSDVQGGGTTQRFLVRFTNGQTVGCDDTRCASLHRGSQVTLLCERVFQFNATEGWACNFDKYGLNR